MTQKNPSADMQEQSPTTNLPDPLAKSLSEAAGKILIRVFGPAADELGEHLAARVRKWRWSKKNIEDITQLLNEELNRRGISPEILKPLPEGDAYRVIDACSLEDDLSVQKLWAGLLASAMDPNDKATASKAFIEILRAVSPVEVGLLLLIRKIETARPVVKEQTMAGIHNARREMFEDIQSFSKAVWKKYPQSDRDIAIQNLMRLRCIGFRTTRQLDKHAITRSLPFGARLADTPVNAAFAAEAFDYLETLAIAATGTTNIKLPSEDRNQDDGIPERYYGFSPLGVALMDACVKDLEVFVG